MKQHNPKEQASCLSHMLFCWLNNLIRLGNQRPLNEEDLFDLTDEDHSKIVVQCFEKVWKQEIKEARKIGRRPRLWKTMFSFISFKSYIMLILLKCIESLSSFSSAVLLWMYLNLLHEESSRESRWSPYILGLGIGMSSLVKALVLHHNNTKAVLIGMRLKIALINTVYKKVLVSPRSSLSRVTAGHVINLISNDAQRMEQIIMCLLFSFIFVVDFPFTIALLWALVGWQSLSGPLVVIVVSFVMVLLSKQFGKLRRDQAIVTDKRLATLNDIITGIRAVKTHAWEWRFRDKVKNLRRKEMKLIRRKSLILSLSPQSTSPIHVTATLASILTMTYSGMSLNAVNTFTTVSLLYIITESTLNLSYCARGLYDGIVSLNRIEEYLLNENLQISENGNEEKSKDILPRDSYKPNKNCYVSKMSTKPDKPIESLLKHQNGPFIKLSHISSSWSEQLNTCSIHNISLNVNSNRLLMVTGPVGSGKTTLLMTILREIAVKSGDIFIQGTIAYVSQIPWIFTGTIRDNILFGKEYEEKKYHRTLEVCDLFQDMDRFPIGDQSMVGQRGVSLSGGQRARVALARAVYSDSDIYLLDDPLSAVDTKVGQHIFDKCICQELSGKIRILVTHQLQHLHRADEIVMLQDGRAVRHGSYNDDNKDCAISKLLADRTAEKAKGTHGIIEVTVHNSAKDVHDGRNNEEALDMVEEEEDRQVGTVSWTLYWNLFRIGLNTVVIVCIIFLYVIAQGTVIAPTWWLKVMATMSYSKQRSSVILGIYSGLVAGAIIIVTIRIFCLFLAFIRSSEILHDRMTLSILKSPVLFFDTNPVGRIMNRFSKDTGTLDDVLPLKFVLSIESLFQFFGVVFLTGIVNYWFILIIIPTVLVFLLICRLYLKTARELSRMEAIRCSPVYEHVSETIKGLEVIHSLKMEDSSLEKMYEKQDQYARVFSMVIFSSRWVGLNIDFLCGLFVTAIGLGIVFLSLDSASTGLIMAYAISLVRFSSLSIRFGSEVETQMISVERILAYNKLPSEPGYDRHTDTPNNWPNQGALSLKEVSMAYMDGGSSILKDINIDVQPREKVGIAGRTGAGKSSLVASLFRLPDPQGQVLVDGIDLGSINVQDARSCMAVITQEPVLFEGSLKKNLDPFDHFTEDEIWSALKAVQLIECVSKLDGQLEYSLGEGGTGFSVGERQLVCLARALLQNRKILILDEATANVDYKTDKLIQQVIRNKFSDRTVLTIAHRLNTIMDYDRVVVLDGGRVVEDDNPIVLSTRNNGVFARLIQEYGGHLSH